MSISSRNFKECLVFIFATNALCGCYVGYSSSSGEDVAGKDIIVWDGGCEKHDDTKHLWSKRFGGISNDSGYSLSVDSLGNVYITGHYSSSSIGFGGGVLTNAGGSCGSYPCSDIFLARFDSNGNHLWSKRFGGSGNDYGKSVSVDSSGNVYGTGYFQSINVDFGECPLSSAGDNDIYLIKYTP